jgi:hypothetical protein
MTGSGDSALAMTGQAVAAARAFPAWTWHRLRPRGGLVTGSGRGA